MAFERKIGEVLPVAFTADGGEWGLVTVANTAGFRVKASAYVKSNTLPSLPVQIKIVLSPTTLIVGYVDNQIANWKRLNISAYTVADDAIIGQEWQDKNKITGEDIWKAVYEADPVVALRTIGVDQYGNFYTPDNPLPVAIDGTISISTVEVKGTNGNFIEPNPDGSLNVIVEPVPVIGQAVKNTYNEVLSVAASATVTIVTYTVPTLTESILQRVHFSGTNIGRYDLLINNVIQDTAHTMFGGDLTNEFNWTTGNNSGFILNAGDVVKIQVNNPRPYVGDYEARIQVLEIAL